MMGSSGVVDLAPRQAAGAHSTQSSAIRYNPMWVLTSCQKWEVVVAIVNIAQQPRPGVSVLRAPAGDDMRNGAATPDRVRVMDLLTPLYMEKSHRVISRALLGLRAPMCGQSRHLAQPAASRSNEAQAVAHYRCPPASASPAGSVTVEPRTR